jgi:outer membrane autotransporter protein
MSKIQRTVVTSGMGLAAIMTASGAWAQVATNLSTYVTAANGASAVQIATAAAVQRSCGSLTSGVLGGGSTQTGGLNLAPNTARRDLFLRCNELVQTAQQLQSSTTTTRSLGLTKEQLFAAVQQVSGEEISAQGSLATQVTAGQFANIGGRLNALRLGGASVAARGRVAALDSEPRHDLYASAGNGSLPLLGGGASADAQGADRPWGWFVESSYGFGDHDQTDNEDGFDFDSVSVTTGTDYNFGSAVVGFSVGFDRYSADFDKVALVSGGDAEVEGITGSVFGAYFGDAVSVSGIASYGSLDSEVTRRAQYTSLNAGCALGCGASRDFIGSPDGSYVALGLTLSHDFSFGGWDLTPSLSGSYRDADIDGYAERDTSANGGLALAFDDQGIKSTRSIVGIALSRPISKAFGVLTPSFRAEWHHEFEDDARTLRAKYVVENEVVAADRNNFACAISCFSFATNPADSDYGIAGAGLSATFAQRLQAYVYYETLLGAADLTSNSIALGVRGSF